MTERVWEWTRKQVQTDLLLAQHLIESGHYAVWTSPSSGVVITEPDEILALGDSALAVFIISHDPQSAIDELEAKSRLLDEHRILVRGQEWPEEFDDFSICSPVSISIDRDRGCIACHYRGQGGIWAKGDCVTVRLIAQGYKRRDGYKAEWSID